MKNAVCFIATGHYLPHLKTALESLAKFEKDLSFYVLNPGDDIDSEDFAVPVKVLSLEDVGMTNLEFVRLLEKNSPFEIACMLKAPLMMSLFRTENIDKLFYADTDLYFTSGIKDLLKDLDTSNIVLIPHLLVRGLGLTPPQMAEEALTVAAGIFNMGFFGLKKSPETSEFLQWWKERVFFRCKRDLQKGFYDDQKWADQIPILFSGVAICRKRGVNVANWNLSERELSLKNGRYMAGTEPLVFFHFSRFRPDVTYRLTEFRDIETDSNPALSQLCYEYAELMLKNGWSLLKSQKLNLIIEI